MHALLHPNLGSRRFVRFKLVHHPLTRWSRSHHEGTKDTKVTKKGKGKNVVRWKYCLCSVANSCDTKLYPRDIRQVFSLFFVTFATFVPSW
jgi:hypothetical protein